MYAGTGLDLPLMRWLDEYTYKAEESIDANEDLGRQVYERLVRRLVEYGTGTALVFGTIKERSK